MYTLIYCLMCSGISDRAQDSECAALFVGCALCVAMSATLGGGGRRQPVHGAMTAACGGHLPTPLHRRHLTDCRHEIRQ